MRSSARRALIGAVAAFSPLPALSAPVLTEIRAPDGSTNGTPQCVSGDAQIVYGVWSQGPFVWVRGLGSTALPDPGTSTSIFAASRDGLIAVGATDPPDGRAEAPVLWVNQAPILLPTDAKSGRAVGLSSDGHLAVGYVQMSADTYRAAAWFDGGPVIDLHVDPSWTSSRVFDASADGSKIVGLYRTAETGSADHLVLFTNGVPREIVPPGTEDYPPHPYKVSVTISSGLKISDDGSLVLVQLKHPDTYALSIHRWSAATEEWTNLGAPRGWAHSYLNAISADGGVIGAQATASQDYAAYLWTQNTGWYNFRQYLIDNGLPALNDPFVNGVSDDGLSMCFWARDASGDYVLSYLLTTEFPPCPGDFNKDGQLDAFDYLDFAAAFAAEDRRADFNRSGLVDFFDYLDFVGAYDAGCE